MSVRRRSTRRRVAALAGLRKAMDCARYLTLVEPALDPDVDPAFSPVEREAMQAHDRWCTRCRDRFEEHRTVFALLETMREPAPRDLAERVLARLAALETHRRRRQALAGAALWTVCGLGAAVVVGALVWNQTAGVRLLEPLGRLATWWYSWLQDLAEALVRLHATSVDVPPVLLALARATRLLLAAWADQLLAGWLAASLAALLLRAVASARRPQLPVVE